MKYLTLTAVIMAALFFTACEEDFSPKTEFEKKYLVNLIIKGDSTQQVAVVGSLYDIQGYDPLTNTNDPLISGAQITITTEDGDVFAMKDTTRAREDSARYGSTMPFYVLNDLRPRQADSIFLRAVMPDGTTLTAITEVPRSVFVSGNETFVSGNHPEVEGDNFVIKWQTSQNILFGYKLHLYYNINYDDGSVEQKKVLIPDYYTGSTPHYPNVTRSRACYYSRDAIDSVFTQISKTVERKSMIRIISARFELLSFDEHLSNYYSSTHGYLDEFSIRLDETVYSNIEGGMGIFGSYYKSERLFPIYASYIASYGFDQ